MAYLRKFKPSDTQSRQCVELRSTTDMNLFIAHFLAEMARAGFAEYERFGVRLSLEEAIVNGIKHGNGDDPSKVVRISYSINSTEIITEIEDQGHGFNPNQVPNPLAPENVERPGGRGVFLMRHYMTTVQYNEQGNRVILSKSRTS
jgi:serine/threonine-protein kinase RsbW